MKTLPIRVDSEIVIRRSDLKAARLSLRDLREPFEYDNPDFWKKERLGFYTGDTERKISLVSGNPEELRLPRGIFDRLVEILRENDVVTEIEDATISDTTWMISKIGALSTHWEAPFELGPDQRSAAKACLRRRSGIVVGPCASGKTEIALRAISLLDERAIVVVHTERILKSWLEKASARFPLARIGAFYGKKKQPDGDVVVGMIRSVLNKVRTDPGWARGFGTFVLDEAHHAPASTFSEVVASFPARNRLAFTATPARKDKKEVLFFDAFGAETKRSPKTGKRTSGPRVLFRITDEMLDRFGRIMPIEVVVVPTDFEFDLNREDELETEGFREGRESAVAAVRRWADETDFVGPLNTYAEMLDAMVRDRRRQARILSYLLPEIAAGNPSLLLADRREFCLELRAWLRRRKIDVGTLMGGKNRKEADKSEELLNSGRILVAVGTTVADEGMDVGCLSRGFGCTPVGSNAGRLTQQFGRFKRLHEGKENARYFYFWDRRITGLRRHLRAVSNVVKAPHSVWYSEEPGEKTRLTKRLIRDLERRER